MDVRKEKCFPRGGKKPALFKSNNNSFFSFLKKSKVKPKKKIKKVKETGKKKLVGKPVEKPAKESYAVKYVEDLKPSLLQDGMLVLGIVTKIMNNLAIVSLPGGLKGAVTLANVSELYRNIIESSLQNEEVPGLNEIFCIGDVLPVKILSVSEEHHSLTLTCDPKIIHEKLSYNVIEKGLVLTGSVKSKEDHGYIIDFGIEHLNGFLSYSKVNENQSLKVGQLVRCCVIQSNVCPGSCNAQLSLLKKDVQSSFVKKNSTLPVFCFIPGLQFEVTVQKSLNEGVEVSYGQGDSKGYIHEDHFLKKFSNPEDLEIGSKVIATLLYVKPFVNFLYFKIMPKKEVEWPFKYGEIVSGKVAKVRRTGVIFRVTEGSRKAKCFVPVSKLQNNTEFQDKSEIFNLYPLNKKVSKIRLGNTDFMGRYYVGATDRASVLEKYYSVSDLKCGEIVSCKIASFGKSSARVEIGRAIKGTVSFTDMTDVPLTNPAAKFKLGQKVKARVIDIIPEKLIVKLTMKPTLLKEKEILCDFKNYKKSSSYVGTIWKVLHSQLVVRFFNHIFGIVPKYKTPYPDSKSLMDHFYQGQLVKCTVTGVQGQNKFLLSLFSSKRNVELEVGKKYKVVVISKTYKGLFLDVIIDKSTKCEGYLPSTLLVTHHSLAAALHSTYSPGEKFSAYCISKDYKREPPIFGAEEVFKDFYEGKSQDQLKKLLSEDAVLPFLFKNKNKREGKIFLRSLIPGENKRNVLLEMHDFNGKCPLFKYQLVYGKVLSIRGKTVKVSTKLSDVWDKDFHSSLALLNTYLKSMTSLVLRQKTKQNAYKGNISLGATVKGVIEDVKANHAIVRTEDGDLGIVEGKFEVHQNITGKIIWIDGPEQMFYVKAKTDAEEDDEKSPVIEKNEGRCDEGRCYSFLRGKVLFINQEVIVLALRGRGRGELAFFPRRRHLNDPLNTESVIKVGEELKLWVTRKDSNYCLAMDRRIVFLQEKSIWKKSENKLKESVKSLKRKLESEKIERLKKRKNENEADDVQVVNVKLSEKAKKGDEEEELVEIKEEKDIEDVALNGDGTPRLEFDDIDIKSEADAEENQKEKSMCNVRNDERIDLSSSSESEDEEQQEKTMDKPKAFEIGFNWEVLNNHSLLSGLPASKEEPSSEDDDDESKYEKKKRRRLTGLEKKEKAKSEEERLRFIEERLMDTEREPENADDFDRAVLANPNSSALWMKYMAFHIQETEFEKARAVGRRALKVISFREEQEKLNVWIALLNLENMYGTEESLNKTLNEALQVNEPYRIHLHMLNLHGQGNKLQEMEKLGNFMLRKYKDIEDMWCDVASAYFSVGKIESARTVLQKALTVVDKNKHVNLISKFAQLENKHGSPERAQTLYESILASFPKRVDIWCCYVDMLTKSNYIDLARQVLERATSQSLRPRKMKTLFKKFLAFEEAHGKPEDVEKVREAAVEYVQSVGALDD